MSNGTQAVRISSTRPHLSTFGAPTPQTARRADEIIGRFEAFMAKGYGVESLSDITAENARTFVEAKGKSGEPSIATMHLRRSALRLMFRIARVEFNFDGDPTLDLDLPPRSSLSARPLTDDEVALGRSFSAKTLTATRQPAAWALSEASATTAELPHITVDDLDLDNPNGSRVWLHGSRKRVDRWAPVDEWCAIQLEQRASAVRNTRHLIYQGEGTEEAQQISCCIAVKETLIRAGLGNKPDVKPTSLMAWAGVKALEETGTIDGVARRLGFRSLDAAAKYIDFNWQQ